MKTLFSTLFILLSMTSFGQTNSKVDLIEFIREIQIWEKDGNNMSLSFWIPTSYWKIALEDNPQIPKETLSQIESAFKDYVFVCALDLDINADGTMDYTEETELRKTILIEDNRGVVYRPLAESNISDEAKSFASAIKPMFTQMFGQIGSGIHFYFFSIRDHESENIINEKKVGEFTIKHSSRNFKYLLPLVTLLPSKKCPKDGATMKGNWNYCPIHGLEL
ncbi:MAG: hypothetical protein HRT66_05055 [Flavobacteriaceae bacterium]|nr:hypothetical protein [Flavobacteriaceae bacterium]